MSSFYVVRRLMGYVWRYRWRLLLLIGLAIIGVLLEVAKPLPIKVVIDQVLLEEPFSAQVRQLLGDPFFVHDRMNLLMACIGSLLVLNIGSALIAYLVLLLTVRLGKQLVIDLSLDFYQKLQQLSATYYSKNQIGDLSQRMNGDIYVVYFIVGQIVIPAITSLLSLLGMFYVMALIDLTLALIAMSVVPLLGLSLYFFSGPMNRTTLEQYQKQGELSAFVQQALSFMRVIQAFVRESLMFNLFRQKTQILGQTLEKAYTLQEGYNQMNNIITGLAGAILVGLGVYKGFNGNISAGDLYIFLGYLTALYGPVNSLATAVGSAITIGARGKRIFEVLDSQEMVREQPNARPLEKIHGEICFDQVSFSYRKGGQQILSHIDLTIEPGKVVALIGPTGAGKTTLISLLTRFYDPLYGRVLIDGQDLRELQLSSVRENISLVMQDARLFPMTIAENISFARPEASREEIVEAAKKAMAHDFISRLPEGYDTVVSEGGHSLSGGERQRVSLAWAFLKDAPIMILDEPTSALDALTEARIFDNLAEYAKGRTVIIISHRLSTIRHADQILTLENGRIVEQGNHESLMQDGKLYAQLYKRQTID